MTTKKSAKKPLRSAAAKKQIKPAKKTAKVVKAAKPVAKKPTAMRTVNCTKCGAEYRTNNPKPGPCIKCTNIKDDSKKKPQKPPARMLKDMMSGMYFFTIEEVRCPIDHEDLARTLGAGQWGYGRGMVDQWSTEVWQKILAHLDLPTEPFIRDVAAMPVKRFVQSVWLQEFDGRALEENKELYASRDKKAVDEYATNLEKASVVVEERRERAVTNLVRAARTPAAEKVYTPTEALKDKKLVFNGQPSLIIECFRKSKFASVTCKQLADALTAAGLKTSQPVERVAMHYLNLWRGKGWLEVSNA
jgi:hypothetical protein